MPLAALGAPCRTSVLSAAPPPTQRPRRFASLILLEPLITRGSAGDDESVGEGASQTRQHRGGRYHGGYNDGIVYQELECA